MKDLEKTWSDIVAKKLETIASDRNFEQKDIAAGIKKTPAYVSMLFGRNTKGNHDTFRAIGKTIGIPDTLMENLLHESLLTAIEQEYGVGIAFALKSHFKLTDRGVRDAMKFLNDLSKADNE